MWTRAFQKFNNINKNEALKACVQILLQNVITST